MIRSLLAAARRRVRFLEQVGLGYLHLNRPTGTLSAGEAQRIQLASLLGSELTALTVLLDEPSRGMHPRELEALQEALEELREKGNTLIVVEHDLGVIQAADYIIDLGPGAGAQGGRIIACGTPEQIARSDTPTGKWLRGITKTSEVSQGGMQPSQDSQAPAHSTGPGSGKTSQVWERAMEPRWLVIEGARENNLRGERVEIPLGCMTGVCGVSGSGKSTLLVDTLGRALVRKTHTTSFAQEPLEPGAHDSITGAPGRTILVDQARKGIQNPAAFLGLEKPLLKIFAASQDAQALGLNENTLGRRCSACKGSGTVRVKMGFLPDLFEECETCRGTGAFPEAWEVRLKGYALPEINALTLDQAYELFKEDARIARPLKTARQVGLGYLVWRQPSYTLSGGEVQRLKIVKELGRKTASETLYILDEPTVGLHMDDVSRLIQVLRRLVRAGHSVVLVEHHPHLLAACDWLIEMGPGGGPQGGRLIASGPPWQVASRNTPTAPYLRQVLASASMYKWETNLGKP